ncbi:response regulator [Actinoplanes sp. HUAS TT8]|uniref:response regulator n=1 Tax=Actinoplanes sp. HUAS TT8 TaxID=3447453 RepID=UPI003F5206B6
MSGRVFDVLVVDDDAADTLMIEEALQAVAAPPAVHAVTDGGEAMEYLRRVGRYAEAPRPNLILLDLNMPRMNGHEVLAELKADDDLKTIPVVVLTTSTAELDVVGSYVRHANAFVTKPMDYDAFESAVQQIERFFSNVAVLPG